MNNATSPHVRSIAFDLIVTVVTFGLFNIYVQYAQIKALNDMLKEEKYSFLKWAIFSILTLGFYHIYHEYRLGKDLSILLNKPDSLSPFIQVLLACFALSFVSDAIQQSEINQYYGVNSL